MEVLLLSSSGSGVVTASQTTTEWISAGGTAIVGVHAHLSVWMLLRERLHCLLLLLLLTQCAASASATMSLLVGPIDPQGSRAQPFAIERLSKARYSTMTEVGHDLGQTP